MGIVICEWMAVVHDGGLSFVVGFMVGMVGDHCLWVGEVIHGGGSLFVGGG